MDLSRLTNKWANPYYKLYKSLAMVISLCSKREAKTIYDMPFIAINNYLGGKYEKDSAWSLKPTIVYDSHFA